MSLGTTAEQGRLRPAPRPAGPFAEATQPIVNSAPVVRADPTRSFAFYAGLVMIFMRFSVFPELLTKVLHFNTYLLYVVGPPAIMGCLVTGGFGLALKSNQVKAWTAFFICMLLATPGSSWIGASASLDLTYFRTDLICMYVVAGLVLTWEEVQTTVSTIALAGIVVLGAAFFWAKPDTNGRLLLDLGFDGVISNSNDLAAQLVLVLPFILYFAVKPGRNIVLRVLLFGSLFYGLRLILGTSSRGAFVGLLAMTAYFLFRASGAQRILVLACILVLGGAAFAVLPAANLSRLLRLDVANEVVAGVDDEAAESSASRQYLLLQSIKYSLQHPLLGIGPGQFSNFEGLTSKAQGKRGNWHETHNTYTEISSECGLPALIFALIGLTGTFLAVNKTYRETKKAGLKEINAVCFCFLASMCGYMVTLFFLAGAYRFTFPALIGLGVAIHRTAQQRLAQTNPAIGLRERQAGPPQQVRRPPTPFRPSPGIGTAH